MEPSKQSPSPSTPPSKSSSPSSQTPPKDSDSPAQPSPLRLLEERVQQVGRSSSPSLSEIKTLLTAVQELRRERERENSAADPSQGGSPGASLDDVRILSLNGKLEQFEARFRESEKEKEMEMEEDVVVEDDVEADDEDVRFSYESMGDGDPEVEVEEDEGGEEAEVEVMDLEEIEIGKDASDSDLETPAAVVSVSSSTTTTTGSPPTDPASPSLGETRTLTPTPPTATPTPTATETETETTPTPTSTPPHPPTPLQLPQQDPEPEQQEAERSPSPSLPGSDPDSDSESESSQDLGSSSVAATSSSALPSSSSSSSSRFSFPSSPHLEWGGNAFLLVPDDQEHDSEHDSEEKEKEKDSVGVGVGVINLNVLHPRPRRQSFGFDRLGQKQEATTTAIIVEKKSEEGVFLIEKVKGKGKEKVVEEEEEDEEEEEGESEGEGDTTRREAFLRDFGEIGSGNLNAGVAGVDEENEQEAEEKWDFKGDIPSVPSIPLVPVASQVPLTGSKRSREEAEDIPSSSSLGPPLIDSGEFHPESKRQRISPARTRTRTRGPSASVSNRVTHEDAFEIEVDRERLEPYGRVFQLLGSEIHVLRELQRDVDVEEDEAPKQLKYGTGTVLFTEVGSPLGRIADVFGRIQSPTARIVFEDVKTMHQLVPNLHELVESKSMVFTHPDTARMERVELRPRESGSFNVAEFEREFREIPKGSRGGRPPRPLLPYDPSRDGDPGDIEHVRDVVLDATATTAPHPLLRGLSSGDTRVRRRRSPTRSFVRPHPNPPSPDAAELVPVVEELVPSVADTPLNPTLDGAPSLLPPAPPPPTPVTDEEEEMSIVDHESQELQQAILLSLQQNANRLEDDPIADSEADDVFVQLDEEDEFEAGNEIVDDQSDLIVVPSSGCPMPPRSHSCDLASFPDFRVAREYGDEEDEDDDEEEGEEEEFDVPEQRRRRRHQQRRQRQSSGSSSSGSPASASSSASTSAAASSSSSSSRSASSGSESSNSETSSEEEDLRRHRRRRGRRPRQRHRHRRSRSRSEEISPRRVKTTKRRRRRDLDRHRHRDEAGQAPPPRQPSDSADDLIADVEYPSLPVTIAGVRGPRYETPRAQTIPAEVGDVPAIPAMPIPPAIPIARDQSREGQTRRGPESESFVSDGILPSDGLGGGGEGKWADPAQIASEAKRKKPKKDATMARPPIRFATHPIPANGWRLSSADDEEDEEAEAAAAEDSGPDTVSEAFRGSMWSRKSPKPLPKWMREIFKKPKTPDSRRIARSRPVGYDPSQDQEVAESGKRKRKAQSSWFRPDPKKRKRM